MTFGSLDNTSSIRNSFDIYVSFEQAPHISGWHENWYVIGYEELLGDPIVVDTKDYDFSVFAIAHAANWIPQPLANSFESFFKKASTSTKKFLL